MKAISLSSDWGAGRPLDVEPHGPGPGGGASSPLHTGAPAMMVYTDSAIGRDVQPLFIPDIAPRWICHVCLAVRIGRLGKCIAERFADRYIDALGLVAVIDPIDAGAIDHPGVLSIMDSAITTGRWSSAPDLPSGQLTMTVGEASRSFMMSDIQIPRLISSVSRASTLKTGDLLILRQSAITLPLEPNIWIRASLSGVIDLHEALRIKVK